MKITRIVQGLWVATLFSTALIATQALMDQTPVPYQSRASGFGDGDAQTGPDGEYVGGDMSIPSPYSKIM